MDAAACHLKFRILFGEGKCWAKSAKNSEKIVFGRSAGWRLASNWFQSVSTDLRVHGLMTLQADRTCWTWRMVAETGRGWDVSWNWHWKCKGWRSRYRRKHTISWITSPFPIGDDDDTIPYDDDTIAYHDDTVTITWRYHTLPSLYHNHSALVPTIMTPLLSHNTLSS